MPKKRKRNSYSERKDAFAALEQEIQAKEEEIHAQKEEIQAKEEELKAREKELDALAEQLRRDRETFEQERSAYVGDASPHDLIRLNIGGTHAVTVQRRTLTCVPGSMLASKFSGRWDDSIPKDHDGAFFIDEDYADFGPILRFLRHKAKIGDEVPIVPPKGNDENFEKLVEYYGLTQSMYPVVLTSDSKLHDNRMLRGLKGRVNYLNYDEWSDFYLISKGVHVYAKTVEIKADTALKGVGVVWAEENQKPLCLTFANNGFVFLQHPQKCSMSLDALRNSDNPQKVVIRSENYGKKWFINGKQVQPSIPLNSRPKDLCFTFMGDGEFEITDLELGDWRL